MQFFLQFITLLDLDEFVMPLKHETWTDMLKKDLSVSNSPAVAFQFRNVYFFTNELSRAVYGTNGTQLMALTYFFLLFMALTD